MTSFLDLSAEIRNRIYTLIFPEQQVLLRCSHPQASMRFDSGMSKAKRGNNRTRLHVCRLYSAGDFQQLACLSPQLLRVCRRIHEETHPFFYANIAIHFHSMKAINSFINVASPRGTQHIQKLALTQLGYGEPRMESDVMWKMKHDKRWTSTCKRIAGAMTGLQHLKLSLQICDWPSQLNLRANWAKSLSFLKGSRGLERVDVILRSDRYSEQRLQAAARMVEKAMMSERGHVQRQWQLNMQEICQLDRHSPQQLLIGNATNAAEEAPRRGSSKPKANKILNIKMEEAEKALFEMANPLSIQQSPRKKQRDAHAPKITKN